MPGASGEWERNPIEEAIGKAYKSYEPGMMDPDIRDTVMGFGPSSLPMIAGKLLPQQAAILRGLWKSSGKDPMVVEHYLKLANRTQPKIAREIVDIDTVTNRLVKEILAGTANPAG